MNLDFQTLKQTLVVSRQVSINHFQTDTYNITMYSIQSMDMYVIAGYVHKIAKHLETLEHNINLRRTEI